MHLIKRLSLLFSVIIAMVLSGCDNASSEHPHSGRNEAGWIKKYSLDKIQLPPGFKIEVYAEIPYARSLALSPQGTVFAGTSHKKVFAITANTRNTHAGKVYIIADNLKSPNGVAVKEGTLFIGDMSVIYRIDSIDNDLRKPRKRDIVYDQFPADKHHGKKFIAFGPDGKLYVPVGAPCNICESADIYASITRMNADGTGFEIFASGVRNTVGFDWHPLTGELWFTDNGRDLMGDDLPGDELNVAKKSGMHFGYPYCHQGDVPDPEFGKQRNCDEFTSPVAVLGPHTAALGMRFNKGNQFPEEYKNAVFIAEHGSWNRTVPVGYRISVVKMDSSGNPKKPEVFASGWLQNDNEVLGRPVDIQFVQDGSMLVSDDYAGVIYRLYYDSTNQ